MKSAPVQNLSSLASLSRAKRRTRSGFYSLFSILVIFIFLPVISFSQTDTLKIDRVSKKTKASSTDSPGLSPYYYLTPEQKRKRQWIVGGINVVGYGASLIIFSNTWY